MNEPDRLPAAAITKTMLERLKPCAFGSNPLELHIAERQIAEVARAISRTRGPLALASIACILSTRNWAHGPAIVAVTMALTALSFSGLFFLPGMRRSRVHYPTPWHGLIALIGFAFVSALGWGLLLAMLIGDAPHDELVGWIGLNLVLLCLGAATYAMIPWGSALYAFTMALTLIVAVQVDEVDIPIALRFLMPLFAIMVHEANLRSFGQFRGHLVATWQLRANQAQREVEHARALALEAEGQRVVRDHEDRQRALEARQREELATQRRRATHDIATRYEASVQAEARALDEVIEGLVTSMTQIARGSVALSTRADDMQGLAFESNEATQEVARRIDSLAESATAISAQVERQQRLSADSGQASATANQCLEALTRETDRIGEIVELVQSLAAQTNLLALNATIEAARAGEAGQGFAVVASEVKQLAAQTQGAISRIGDIVAATRSSMTQVQGAMSAIDRAVGEAAERAERIAGAVNDQRRTTEAMGANAEATAHVAARVQSLARQLASDLDVTEQHSRQIQNAIEALRGRSTMLRQTGEDFIDQLRSSAG